MIPFSPILDCCNQTVSCNQTKPSPNHSLSPAAHRRPLGTRKESTRSAQTARQAGSRRSRPRFAKRTRPGRARHSGSPSSRHTKLRRVRIAWPLARLCACSPSRSLCSLVLRQADTAEAPGSCSRATKPMSNPVHISMCLVGR